MRVSGFRSHLHLVCYNCNSHNVHSFFVGLPILDTSNVRERWLKPTNPSNTDGASSQSNCGTVVALKALPSRIDRSNTSGRYNEVLDVCKELASMISLTGGKQYEARLNVLQGLVQIYLSGKEAKVTVSDEGNGLLFQLYFNSNFYAPLFRSSEITVILNVALICS